MSSITVTHQPSQNETVAHSHFDEQPNEIIRMVLEHMSPQQRIAVARISKIWCYLGKTFPIMRDHYLYDYSRKTIESYKYKCFNYYFGNYFGNYLNEKPISVLQLFSNVPNNAISDFFSEHEINCLICYGGLNSEKIQSISFDSLFSLYLEGDISTDDYCLILEKLNFKKIITLNLHTKSTTLNYYRVSEIVSKIIKDSDSLKQLSIITHERENSSQLLAEALKANNSLESLKFFYSDFSSKGFEAIVKALEERLLRLKYLNIKNIEYYCDSLDSPNKEAFISRLTNAVDILEC